jgi:transcriptional regulator with XRE-family HTH domain
MTPTHFRQCLTLLDWTQRGLARQLGYAEGTVRQWARGALPIPDQVADWLVARADHAEATPAPRRKRVDRHAQKRLDRPA